MESNPRSIVSLHTEINPTIFLFFDSNFHGPGTSNDVHWLFTGLHGARHNLSEIPQPEIPRLRWVRLVVQGHDNYPNFTPQESSINRYQQSPYFKPESPISTASFLGIHVCFSGDVPPCFYQRFGHPNWKKVGFFHRISFCQSLLLPNIIKTRAFLISKVYSLGRSWKMTTSWWHIVPSLKLT